MNGEWTQELEILKTCIKGLEIQQFVSCVY